MPIKIFLFMYNISSQVVVQWYFIIIKRQSRQTDRNMSLNRSLEVEAVAI